MKNIKLALLALTVALLSLLFACAAPEPECPPHLDEDKNYICDRCETELEPDIPSVDLSDIRLGDAYFTYDGTERTISIRGELPDGVSVRYDGNGVTNAGKYTVTASFWYSIDGKEYHLDGRDLTATITINKATYDLSGITFPSLTVSYDGKEHTPSIIGELPEGVEVSYVGGAKSEMGEYLVTANFIVDETNYVKPTPMSEYLIITGSNEALAGISVRGIKAVCDGEVKLPTYEGTLGEGASFVGYEGSNTSPVLPGMYQIFLVFSDGFSTLRLVTSVEIVVDPSVGTDGLIYEPVTGGVAIIGYEGTSKAVIIPDKLDGKSVVSIASGAFMDSDIIYAYLPDSLTNIGNNAFRGCTALEAVRLGDRVKVVGSCAFRDTALTELELPESLEAIGYGAVEGVSLEKLSIPFIGGSHKTSNPYLGYIFGADGYGGNSLFVPSTLKEVTLLDSCLEIAPRAFYECASLEKVNIGEGVTKIGSQAFAYTAITEIFIPKNVTDIPAAAEDASVSPFFGLSEELVINVEAAALPDGFGTCWCVIATEDNKNTEATVNLGATK